MGRQSTDISTFRNGLVNYKFITKSMEVYLNDLLKKNYEYLMIARDEVPLFKSILEGLSIVLVEAKRVKMNKELGRQVEFSEASNYLSNEDIENFSYDIMLMLYSTGYMYRNLNNEVINEPFESVW